MTSGRLFGDARHVERPAEFQFQRFVLGRVIDLIAAEELALAVGVQGHESDPALGQRPAQSVGLLVLDDQFGRQRAASSIEEVAALRLDIVGRQQAELLDLAVLDRARLAERVEFVLEEVLGN